VELADGGDGSWPALGLADHAEQAGLGEHLANEDGLAGGGEYAVFRYAPDAILPANPSTSCLSTGLLLLRP
jgi:hypothetical protein